MTTPKVWHLNSAWGEHNLTQPFVTQGFWEIDPAKLNDMTSINRLLRVKCGDIVHLVSYSRNVCRTTEAIGTVMGTRHKQLKLLIAWQQLLPRQRDFYNGSIRPITEPPRAKASIPKTTSQ